MKDATDSLTLECEIIQGFVDRNRDEGFTGLEAFRKARYELSCICQFHWELIRFDELNHKVVPVLSNSDDVG